MALNRSPNDAPTRISVTMATFSLFFAGIEQKLREGRHKLGRHIIHAEVAYVFKRINNS